MDALAKLNDEINSNRIAPQYTFNPNIADQIGQWTSTGAYAGKPAAGLAPASFQMGNSSEATDYSKTTWAASGGGGGMFWRASGSTSGSTESLVSNKSTYDMAVNFQATSLVLATAKNINTVFLNEYKNGPWIDGSMIGTGKAKPFGEGGLFPMMITEMLVVYNPSITMKMDQSSYKYAKTTMQAHVSGGGGWGPFSYGGSADSSYTHTKTNFDDANASVTIQDVSNNPKIVAVRAHILP